MTQSAYLRINTGNLAMFTAIRRAFIRAADQSNRSANRTNLSNDPKALAKVR
jgi:hypothetical protein